MENVELSCGDIGKSKYTGGWTLARHSPTVVPEPFAFYGAGY